MNRRRAASVAGLVIVSSLAGGTAVAAVTQATTISACTTPAQHVRVLGSDVTCKSGETKVTWNLQGERGLPGAPGEQGETGPAGPQGTAGSGTTVTYVDRVVTVEPGGERREYAVTCPDGTKVVNGFVRPSAAESGVNWDPYYSHIDPARNAWMIGASEAYDRVEFTHDLEVQLVCLG